MLTTIATFEYAHLAHLAKAKLASEGIESFLDDENTTLMIWIFSTAIGGIKLKVLASGAEKAIKILEENDATLLKEVFDSEGSEELEEVRKCPRCDSDNIIDEKYSKNWAYLSILFFGFPLLFKKKKFLCVGCKHTWNK